MIKLKIYSDPVCPWCYIGKARLDSALRTTGFDQFKVSWAPFQLNPQMPQSGMNRTDYLRHKFNGDKGAARAYRPVHDAAAECGLHIRLDRIKIMPNSLNAHRLIRWAEIDGQDVSKTVAALFEAFFVEGRNIGDEKVLLDIAEACGGNRKQTMIRLGSDDAKAYVTASDRQTRSANVTGVPLFVIADQFKVYGAQPINVWMKLIDQLQNHTASM